MKLQHIALILDGNRRWASAKNLPKMMGHLEGAKNIRRIAKAAIEQHIPFVTMYVLSTENLKNRSQKELDYLFSLFEKIIDYIEELLAHDVRLRIIGDITKLPASVQQNMQETAERTKNNSTLTLSFAANYGGRDEITRAVQKIIQKQIPAEDITEARIQEHLDTAEFPDVDLVIRTGGNKRLSNYLPWQSTYAELYFTDTQWPAFSPKDLQQAIDWFYEQQRNNGK